MGRRWDGGWCSAKSNYEEQIEKARRHLAHVHAKICMFEAPADRTQFPVYVIREKGLDEGDKVLRQSITYRLVQALRLQWKRGKVESPKNRMASECGAYKLQPSALSRLDNTEAHLSMRFWGIHDLPY